MTELYLRLGAATLLLLAPGALVARSASGALVVSLTILFGAMVVVFAAGASLDLALWIVVAAAVAALPLLVWRRPRPPDPFWLGVLAAGIGFGVLLWRVLPPASGDALFHLARVRKLHAFDELSLEGVGEFADGGLHPGYAFPLWHAFLALVARVGGVEPTQVATREAALLAPLSFLVVYEAGKAVFRSRWLGVATLAATVGLTALSAGSGGAFRSLALPATAGGRQLLVPAAIAVLLVYLREPTWPRLAFVACAGLALAVVHPTYAVFTLLLFGGFALARVVLAPRDALPLALGVGAFAVAAGLFLAWLYPVVRTTASHTPTRAQLAGREHGFEQYPGQFDVDSPQRFRLAPEVVARAGAVPVAGLAAVPLALLAIRRRWAAFVVGGTLALLAVLLVPVAFTPFAEAVSLSQARRLAGFVPFAFAVAGGAAVLSGLVRWAALPLAAVAGFLVQREWPGDFGYVLKEGGPLWPVWVAAVGGAAALAAGAVLRDRLPRFERCDWVAAAACALFVLPIALETEWSRPRTAQELTPALVDAVRREADPGDVVLADPETSYWLAAYAPVYVAVAAPAHVADTDENRPYERVEQWKRFVRTERFPARYDWLVLDRKRVRRLRCRPVVFRGPRYVLCPGRPRR